MPKKESENIDQKPKKQRHFIFRKTFLTLLTLFITTEAALWFFAAPLLRTGIQAWVASESKGVYSVEFSALQIELTTRTLKLNNFRLKADTARYGELKRAGLTNKALYQIEFDQLKFSRLGIVKLLRDADLSFREVSISNPMVNLISLPKKDKQEEKYDAIHNDLYATIEPYLNALTCKKITLTDGYFDMYLAETDMEQKTSADRISVILYDFRIDEQKYKQKNELFYAKNFYLKTENYRLLLNDKIHSVLVGEIEVSSRKKEIFIENAVIRPGFVSQKTTKNPIYYAEIPEIKFYGTDIYKAWFDKDIRIDSIYINAANIKIVSPKSKVKTAKLKKQKTKIKTIFDLVKGKINSAQVRKFTFNNAKFEYKKGIFDVQQKINIDNCSLSLENFVLDSLSAQRNNKIMFADNFTLSVADYSMKFAKQTHRLTAEKFIISTKEKTITAQGIRIKPRQVGKIKHPIIMNIYIPTLKLTAINFLHAYNTGVLNTGGLFINHPSLNITQFGSGRITKKGKKKGAIYNIIEEYLNTLRIATFRINNGKFNYINKTKEEKDAFSKGVISLKMNRVKLDRNTALYSDKVIHAQTFEVELSDYSMKTNTDFHIIEAALLRVSSTDSLIYAEELKILPKYKHSTLEMLKKYQKNNYSEINLPKFAVKGVDVQKAIFGKQLSIESIYLLKPKVKISTYPSLKFTDFEKIKKDSLLNLYPDSTDFFAKDSTDIFADSTIYSLDSTEIKLNNAYKNTIIHFLKGKMNIVDIQNVKIDSGFIEIETKDTLNTQMSSFDSYVSARMHHFLVNQDSLQGSYNKFLFADSLQLKVYDFSTILPDKLHKVMAGQLIFSSADSSIRATQLRIFPLESRQKTIQKPSSLILYFPGISITGINPERLLTEKYAEINTIDAQTPAVILTRHLDIPQPEKQDSSKKAFKIALPKGLNGISIAQIAITGGKIELANEKGKNISRYGTTDLNLLLKNISLDSANLKLGKPLLTAKEAKILLTDTKFTLPDSIHKFSADTLDIAIFESRFTGVNVNFSYDSLLNTHFLPRSMTKNALIAFNIPRVEAQGLNYLDIITKKNFFIEDIAINSPEIKIHQFKKPKKKKTLSQTEAEIMAKLAKKFKAFNIQNLKITDANITLKNTVGKKNSSVKMEAISGTITDFDIDSIKNIDKKRLLLAKDISLHFHKYSFIMKDSMYNITLNEIGISSLKSNIYVNDFSMMPRYGQYEFAKVNGLQKGVMYIEGKKVEAQNIDLRALIEKKSFDIKKVTAQTLKMHIFKDKQLAEDTAKRPIMPLDLIRKAKNKINIDSVILKNSYIAYEQNSKKKSSTGIFTLEDLGGTITNLTNDTSVFKQKKFTRMQLNAKLMGKGQMNASFRFPLSTEKSEYLLAGTVDTFDLAELNPMIENTVFVAVTQGQADKLQFHMKANPNFAEGKMRLYYKNLKIKIKDTTNSQRNGASMLANSILRSNNPKRKGRKLIEGKIYSEQVIHKNVFHLWTQAIISGAVSSLGYRTKQMKNKDKLMKLLKRKKKKQDKIDRKTEKKLKKEMEQELRRMAREARRKARKNKQ